MLDVISLDKIVFLDIETVPAYADYHSLNDIEKELWLNKVQFLKRNESDSAESLYPRAGIYAEFGKIVCISVGHFTRVNNKRSFNISSFFGDSEKDVLNRFILFLNKIGNSSTLLCAHNGKEFDFPYMCRRMIINRFKIPEVLNISGKKPWEVNHLDTMELWRFGDYKSYTPLKLLTYVAGLPSPKDDMDGSDVSRVYWRDRDLNKIAVYCQKDVVAVANILLFFKQLPYISEDELSVT